MIGRRALVFALAVVGCETASPEPAPESSPAPDLCERNASLDALPDPKGYDYDYACVGEVPPSGEPVAQQAVADDCATGIWPDLDDRVDVCPTVSEVTQVDPVSGETLPSDDDRPLPTELPITESGSFLPADAPSDWPPTLRVVTWNMEYTASLDAQIEVLTTHPELSTADVYLLSEVDRCSTRSGLRRSAHRLAQALGGEYVYGIEFVELNIGREVGGDTGQAIISRRGLSGARLTCHSSQHDWFASEDEPRLGQRVVLHADVPVGDHSVRVYAVHLESEDLFGDKRSVQSKEILDEAQALACERPQVVAGDFNAPYCGSPTLQVFRDAGFVDAVGLAGDRGPTHTAGFRLDYLFSRGLSVVDGGVVRGLDASDHDALWVDLAID